ncbi:MAG: NUDIX domain-containing protein, partial [Owenweeksia sp.]
VGDYTAAAISSLAFNEAHAVVDGNVYRVLSRFLGIDTPINSTTGKKEFAIAAGDMLDVEDPASYNQAIMEFGALQCVPKNPDCEACVLKDHCVAYKNELVDKLPVKKRIKYDRKRFFHYIMIHKDGWVLVEKREGRDIWRQLFQFPLIEAPDALNVEELITELGLSSTFKVMDHVVLPAHKLSHQTLHISILKLNITGDDGVTINEGQNWVAYSDLQELAFPRPLRQYLDQNQLTLPFGSKA